MFIKPAPVLLFIISLTFLSCNAQTNGASVRGGMSATAQKFLETLSEQQKAKAQFSYDDSERYDWHYIPKERKGITLGELNDDQRKAAMNLLHTGLSDTGYNKTVAIITLQTINSA